MVLPQGVLRTALHGPVLVELKNGDSYSGTLAAIDHLMNIKLEDAIFTPRSEHRFEKLTECMIRGQFVKFFRFPDELLAICVAQENASRASEGRGKGRKGKGGKGGRGDSRGDARCLEVPAALIGMIIGRGGETIRRFSEESGAQIEVARDQSDSTEQQVRNIYLRGAPECVEKAYEKISAFVREKSAAREGKRPSHGRTPQAQHGRQREVPLQPPRSQPPLPRQLGVIRHGGKAGAGGKGGKPPPADFSASPEGGNAVEDIRDGESFRL